MHLPPQPRPCQQQQSIPLPLFGEYPAQGIRTMPY